ncbi:hypothetical protein ABBQ32_001507 [Trebouxia sp. C0010 RCD-2024]
MAGIKLYPMRTFLRRHGAADCARSTSLLVVQQADLCTTAKLSFLDSFTAMAAKSWSEYWVVNRDARCRSGRHRCGISLQAHKQQSVQKPSKDVGQGADFAGGGGWACLELKVVTPTDTPSCSADVQTAF